MKTLNEILDNYKDYAVVLDDRFGSRLAKFLTEEQLEKIGFKYDGDEPYPEPKECNNIPFILGQFDSIEEAEAALPSTNKKGAKHFVVCSTEQLKSARAAISYLQEELRKSREEVRQWRDLELKTRLDFSNQICELSKIANLTVEDLTKVLL